MPHMPSSGGGHHGSSQNGGGGGHHGHHQSSSHNNSKPVKMKRTRQRVDAGEPRNSYASIANFSSRGGYHGYNHKSFGSNNQNNNSSSNQSNTNNNTNNNNPTNNVGSNLSHHNSHYHHPQSHHSIAGNNHPGSTSSSTGTHHHHHHQQPQHHHQLLQNNLHHHHHQQQQQQQHQLSSDNAQHQFANNKTSLFPFGSANSSSGARPEQSIPNPLLDGSLIQSLYHNICFAGYSPHQIQQNQQHQQQVAAAAAAAATAAKIKLATESADQFSGLASNPFYNAAFLNQLQPANLDQIAMVNFLNNLQNAEPATNSNQLFQSNTGSVDAQLLRDILESGAGRTTVPDNTKAQQLAFQQAISNKLSYLNANSNNEPKMTSRNIKAKRFIDSESPHVADTALAASSFEFDTESILNEMTGRIDSSCLEPTPASSSHCVDNGKNQHDNQLTTVEQERKNTTRNVARGADKRRTVDTDEEEEEEDGRRRHADDQKKTEGHRGPFDSSSNPTKDVDGEAAKIQSSVNDECGSGNTDDLDKEVVNKKTLTRDGNLPREEQRRGRGRPPLHSLAQRRSKSTADAADGGGGGGGFGGSSSSSSSSSSPSGIATAEGNSISLAEQTSFASFLANVSSDADHSLQPTLNQQTTISQDLPSDDQPVGKANSDIDQQQKQQSNSQLNCGDLVPNSNRQLNVEVEDIAEMLLDTSAQVAINNSDNNTEIHHRLSPKSEDDTNEMNSLKQTSHSVNGCKKRKLYQPQQSSKMIDNINGSIDTEDDDLEEEEEVVEGPEVEDISVEAELDEGYDETSAEDRPNNKNNKTSNTDNIANKELDLSVSTANNNSNNGNSRSCSIEPTIKRARLSDYERDINKLQQQIMQKYTTMQFYNHHQQQQQIQPQSKSPTTTINGTINHQFGSNNNRTSPVNLTAECDNTNDLDGIKDPLKAVQQQQPRQSTINNQQSDDNRFLKIFNIDLFIENVTDQICSKLNGIIGATLRQQLEEQNRVKDNNTNRSGASDLLAKMLDSKYNPRNVLLKPQQPQPQHPQDQQSQTPTTSNNIILNNNLAASPNNGNKNSGCEASPFVLPSEASPAPKSSFVYPPSTNNPLNTNFYGKPTSAANLYATNLAAAYTNLSSARDNALLLNGFRDNQSSNSSSSNMVFGREDSSPVLPEQTEAIPLVVGSKSSRRRKVTDTRLTPRTITRIPREDGRETASVSPPITNGQVHFPPSSVPVPLASLHPDGFFDSINPSATHFPFPDQPRLGGSFFTTDDVDFKNGMTTDGSVNGSGNDPVASAVAKAAAAHHLKTMLASSRASPDSVTGYSGLLLNSYGRGSGTGSENGGDGSETNDTQSIYDPSMPMTSTLSPMHLRKAKLMFFYVRYPSSSILKMFFPDIKFNKNNTAQLVKWFSNFREFYYIQMEKYARQALSEGIKNADDLHVTDDCELLRVLNLHYNRSNHIPIPENFRTVSETTLREFFKSLQQNKDTEQSWKKAIYKIIARLDDNVPEYFKNPNFMEQLE